MLFHEFPQHLVLALEFGFQEGDALGVGVGLGAARPLEGGRSVLEQRLLPNWTRRTSKIGGGGQIRLSVQETCHQTCSTMPSVPMMANDP